MTTGMRHIPLEGADNVRDVGGYATADGRLTKWKACLRSDRSLDALTSEAQQQLRRMACEPLSTCAPRRRWRTNRMCSPVQLWFVTGMFQCGQTRLTRFACRSIWRRAIASC
ncbi:MAG: tyrosine-protein phosphatase [Chloroflexi bacterium]|nr:tyrosine-protein phosphatase [Chloroflexota bacterium]